MVHDLIFSTNRRRQWEPSTESQNIIAFQTVPLEAKNMTTEKHRYRVLTILLAWLRDRKNPCSNEIKFLELLMFQNGGQYPRNTRSRNVSLCNYRNARVFTQNSEDASPLLGVGTSLFTQALMYLRGDFRALEVGRLFWTFCLGPPYEKSQKMADFSVFAKIVITRICGQFGSRWLRQKIFRWLYFQRILIIR